MPVIIDPNAYYTSAEYAELIGKTQKTVETERSRGTGAPFCKHGARVLYAGKSIVAYLDANERQHGAAVKAAKERPEPSPELPTKAQPKRKPIRKRPIKHAA